MKVFDAIAQILKQENIEFVSAFPTNTLIDAIANAGIRVIICRQERVGVGIADGYTRVNNGKRTGVFTMQFGPGAENAFAGVATTYADSVPVLLLPAGHRRDRNKIPPFFSSSKVYAPVTKYIEEMVLPNQVSDTMRRAFSQLRVGRPGPVMIEVPRDVLAEEVSNEIVSSYRPVKGSRSQGNIDDVTKAAKALFDAKNPVILAGQGVLYAEGCDDLLELSELLDIPVMTTLEGKSAFPEDHPLALGSAALTNPGTVVEFLGRADVVLAVGCSLTKHAMAITIPPGKMIIQVSNDGRDISKDYIVEHPILGDAKLVLRQFIQLANEKVGKDRMGRDTPVQKEVKRIRHEWLEKFLPVLTSGEVPISPYRVIWELINAVDPADAIVSPDAGSPRDMILPFYKATVPRSFIGWGKSHGLGTSVGLIMGAKLAKPDKFCVNLMGDGAFGMTGLDFETSVRSNLPITTIVWNNGIMGSEKEDMMIAHEKYGVRYLSGNYAEMGKAMGGYSERIEKPEDIAASLQRARAENAKGRSALLEYMTGEFNIGSYSHMRPF
jgi:acetolactate synthase I/II/III large subunit